MSFAELGLSAEVLRAIAESGYTTPTPIQAMAIPVALSGRDLIGIAQTGTGKTAGFTLPMIEKLAAGRAKARMPRSLVLEPTRELAAQVAESFEKYGKYHKLTMALLIGGVSFGDQDAKIDRGVDVLIATPGRLLDHFERGKLSLDVRDEAHVEHAVGFVDDELLDAVEQELAALEVIEQAAGRGDENVDAAGELRVLFVERHAADHQRDVELLACAVFFEALLYLCGELARGLQDERARHARPGAAILQPGDHRQCEGGGLAGAGLGDAEHVAARQHVRDRLFLDRGRGGVAGRLNRGENFVGQAELGKGHKTSSRDRPEPSRAG